MKLTRIKKMKVLDFYTADTGVKMELPYAGNISAGFPSPADDYMDMRLDLNRELVRNPNATFYGRVKGNSMQNIGIHDGDVLVIDRSLEPANDAVAVCYIDGEFTVKRVHVEGQSCYLMPENSEFKPIPVSEDNHFLIWGIVTYVIKKMKA
ncbi:MAG: translesion error-prone DNA polymerase V autoproteolytic subunit [Candidatus Neomarinimicrobiota bacterium]|nr:translesion error-prone DNA polymerase V autoproteolytic subunit [Candidatus Neomarinimicrobiota bacterium]MDD3966384.1 translesion error-prone DNA polymerase V autoproteolytic subunit [Candidatus Neomarinimicrobiota bacterium]